MASSVDEPDLFNDVEILEIGDFNTEGDENYVSVELRSDNDDDDEDTVLLDPRQFPSPKALHTNCIEATHSRAMAASVQHHRFLSDHEYLDNGEMHNLVPREVANDQIAIKVQNSNERFSVPYDEELGMQDLFNDDNAPPVGPGKASMCQDEYDANGSQIAYDEYFETKIEIGETEFHEMVIDNEFVGHEMISHQSDAFDSQDECMSILQSLDNTVARGKFGNRNRSTLQNDHSYTTIILDSPEPSAYEDSSADEHEEPDPKKLVTLSNKLAKEDDVTSMKAQKTMERIENMVKCFRRISNEKNVPQGKNASFQDKGSSDTISNMVGGSEITDSLSVQLSANCSERMECDGIVFDSTVTQNGHRHDDTGSDTECAGSKSSQDGAAPELDELISLGKTFSEQCKRWFENKTSSRIVTTVSSSKRTEQSVKLTQLSNIFEKITRQCAQIPLPLMDFGLKQVNPTQKVETAVQTERSRHSKYLGTEQRTLNEQCKKRLLASGSDSSNSSLSDSEDSPMAKSSDSDGAGEKMMNDFVRRNRRMRKSAKDKRKGDAEIVGDRREDKNRVDQIYSDTSSDGEQVSGRDRDRAEGEENLLDGVLSGVDEILSDVHDILPDAVGVVQDYLAGEDQREGREEPPQKTGPEPKEPNVKGAKNVKEMTESEREDYYEDMQIERLCNISSLIVCRNASASSNPVTPGTVTITPKVKDAKDSKTKKVEKSMYDFLNDEHTSGNSDQDLPLEPAYDDSSESEKDVAETEEQFLQKCNESVKLQLLNHSSSSDTLSDGDNTMDDGNVRTSVDEKQNGTGDDDSNVSFDSLVEQFLKRHDSKSVERKKRKKDSLDDGALQNGTSADLGPSSLKHKSDDAVGMGDSSEKGELGDTNKKIKQKKLELAHPKDKALFSKNLFGNEENSDESPTKKRRKRRSHKAHASGTDTDLSNSDSDVELIDGMLKKRKRNRKPVPTLATFDFSASLNSNSTTQREAPIPGKETTAGESTVATKTSVGSGTERVTASPVSRDPASTSIATTSKPKPSKEGGQDCISLSSDSSDDTEIITGEPDDNKTTVEKEVKRKIRPMLKNDELAEETKKAQKEEEGRVARLKKKLEQVKKFVTNFRPGSGESHLVLDYDSTRKQAISVHPDIVKMLKPHQIEGIKFMYDNTYGSVDALPKHQGSGCILAHCMGLGKTLQMISLLHTVMRYPQLLTNRVLVICPKSTVMNWKEEICRWQGTIKTGYQMKVYCFPDVCTQNEKISVLKRWFSCKTPSCGVMLIGYEAFRALINYERRKGSVQVRSSKLELIKQYLLNPGADLVICDEGHQIKNKRSAISEAVSKIKTRRRIMLTGTPIQNNLKEYYCMVNFIKPSFLGSDKEFGNLYGNPIKSGQCKDSDQQAIKIMKQRSYVLHNKLSKFVQRKEAAVLKEFLPEKFEYVLFVPLTPVQEKMYEVFLQMNEYTSSSDMPVESSKMKKFKLIADYTSLRKIWTHPKVLEKAWESANQEKSRKDAARKTSTPDSYDESPDDNNDIASGQLSVTNDWWRQFLQTADLESLYPSNKMWILFEILKQCNERGEKCLIFSAFVAVLNVVEHFMSKIHNQDDDRSLSDAYAYTAFKGPWVPGKDYYRLDGKTQKSIRHEMITSFNNPQNTRTKCFLISAKAGGQGINLTGANRVIILDTAWNPSNDQQNIFRIFRLGQKRKCYVYRLIAAGTMEEKVYSRSVTKQALSFRVVDEQQIDRHYSYGELAELYTLTKLSEMTREIPILPADDVLASLLRTFPNKIFKYHEHDSLLENKPEQDLSEEEKKEAWAAYEREIQNNENRTYLSQFVSTGAAAAAAAAGGLFGAAGYGSSMASYYSGFGGYPGIGGLPMSGGDMFRNDYSSYGSSMGRSLYMPYGSQQQHYAALLNDPAYASVLAKMYGSFSVPGTGLPGLDFGLPSLAGHSSPIANGGQSTMPPVGGAPSGQGTAGKAAYSSTAALANMLSFYPGKPSSGAVGGLPPGMAGPNQSTLQPSTGTSLAELAAQHAASSCNPSNHYNPLKQISDYAQGNSSLLPVSLQSPSTGLTISNITSLHKPTLPPSGKQSGGSMVPGFSSLYNRLSDPLAPTSPSPLTTVGVPTSPFAPRNVPLLSPTIEKQARSSSGILSTSSTGSTNTSTTLSSLSSSLSIPSGTHKGISSVDLTNDSGLRSSFTATKSVEKTPIISTGNRSSSLGIGGSNNQKTLVPSDEEGESDSRHDASIRNVGATKKHGSSVQVNDMPPKSVISLENLTQQPSPKSMSPKVPSKPTTFGQISQALSAKQPVPNAASLQLTRSNSAAAVSSGGSTVQQAALLKSVSTKARQPSPTLKITNNSNPQPMMGKPSPLARSPLTVQVPQPTNKVTPKPAVTASSGGVSPAMRFMLSDKAATAPIKTTTATSKDTASVSNKQRPSSLTVISRPQTATAAVGIAKTIQKPTVMVSATKPTIPNPSTNQAPKPINPLAVSKNVILQSSAARNTISPATPNVGLKLTKIGTRPMTVTMTPVSTANVGGNVATKVIKKPVTPSPLTVTVPKPAQTTSLANVRSLGTVSTIRPINTLQKTAVPTVKPVPVAKISTTVIPAKLTVPAGTGNNRSVSVAQPTVVKTITPTTTQHITLAKSTVTTVNTNRALPVVNRLGKGVVGVNALSTTSSAVTPTVGLGNITITKTNPTTITTSSGQHLPVQAGRASGNPSTTLPSNMTVIPLSNLGSTTTAGTSTTTVTRPTYSYSYNEGGRKDLVIRKAVASPTMRRILPAALGSQQIVINKSATSSTIDAIKTIMPSSGTTEKSTIPVKSNVGGTSRVGSNTSAVAQAMVGGIQSTTPNSVFIRKRGIDATTLDGSKLKNTSVPAWEVPLISTGGQPGGKRTRFDEMTVVTSGISSAPFIAKNQTASTRTVPAKSLPKAATKAKDDTADVVVLE